MKRWTDFIPHPAHGVWGAVLIALALLVWPSFVTGMRLLEEGRIVLGGILIAISACAGGVHVRSFRGWLQLRRRLTTISRKKPTMMTDRHFAEAYKHFATKAVEEFNEAGSVSPKFFAVAVDETNGDVIAAIVVPPQLAAQFYRDDNSKDWVKPMVRFMLDAKSPIHDILTAADIPPPDLVVQISEAWQAFEEAPREGAVDLTQPRTPPSERPDRTECIAVFVHSINRTEVGFSPIHTEPTRRAEYAPMFDDVIKTGRMMMNPPPSEDPTVTKH